jgi:hypothetical protein
LNRIYWSCEDGLEWCGVERRGEDGEEGIGEDRMERKG